MRHSVLCTLLGLVLHAAPGPLWGQELPIDLPVPLDGVTAYDPAVPSPEAVLGHRIGTRHTRPAQLVEYFKAIAELSPRVTVEEYARSHQGRPLLVGIVTSPENHARIDEIRRENLQLSDTPSEVSEADLERMPTIVYLGYGVHGNEGSTSETAVLLLYHLAAGNGPAVQEILDRTVILIDPSLNPDGRSRFVEWVNNNRSRGAHHRLPGPGAQPGVAERTHEPLLLRSEPGLGTSPAARGPGPTAPVPSVAPPAPLGLP
jgi:hypothetical protein